MADTTTEVQKLYVAYFSRPADPEGLAFWTTQMQTNANFYQAISAAFSTSGEYQATYAGMNNTQVVQTVYQHLFGRAGEDTGVAFWVDKLDRHIISIDNVVTQIATGAQGTDLFAYNAKAAVAVAFTQHIDTDVEKQAYTKDAAAKIAIDYLAHVTDLESAATARDPGNIDLTISQMVNAAGMAGFEGAHVVGVAEAPPSFA
jgi:Domain of unknown function (DUF4214)